MQSNMTSANTALERIEPVTHNHARTCQDLYARANRFSYIGCIGLFTSYLSGVACFARSIELSQGAIGIGTGAALVAGDNLFSKLEPRRIARQTTATLDLELEFFLEQE